MNLDKLPANHLFIHYVIAVGGKVNTVSPDMRQQVESYLSSIVVPQLHS